MVWILVLLIRRYRSATPAFRKQIVLMGVGIEFFLFSFFTMTSLAAYLTSIGILQDSSLEFYGLFDDGIHGLYRNSHGPVQDL